MNLGRGKETQYLMNNYYFLSEIIRNSKFIFREKTLYQDLRIYDTLHMGRVLVLDGMIQITNELEDNYTVDLTREVVKKDKDYNHILIIGGGDLIIARYLVEKFPNVKQITLCEIDAKVVEAVKKYFNIIGESIDKAIANKKLTVNIGDGAVFAKECAEKKN